jgi:hypothetical protein
MLRQERGRALMFYLESKRDRLWVQNFVSAWLLPEI